MTESLIQGYIFDIDGTLLDSTPGHLSAWQKALNEIGIAIKDEEILIHFGKPTTAIAAILLEQGKLDPNQAKQIAANKSRYFVESIPNLPLYEGVNEILEYLYENGYKICFASANYNFIIQKIMDVHDWHKISVGFIGVDDVKKSKPDPEMVIKAAEKLNLNPDQCAMIGDSTYDILAGKVAGCYTVAVCTKHPKKVFADIKTDLVLESITSMKDLLPLKFSKKN